MTDDRVDSWPAEGVALLGELEAARGRVALIGAAAPAAADDLVERLRVDLGVEVVSIGRALADGMRPPSAAEVEAACGEATVITDLEVILWPDTRIAPLQFLTARARQHPTIAVWPGHIAGGRATYSAPGRPDYHDIALRDVVLLQPCGTRFPDEAPFSIERILR